MENLHAVGLNKNITPHDPLEANHEDLPQVQGQASKC
jgi:hypothetical protein